MADRSHTTSRRALLQTAAASLTAFHLSSAAPPKQPHLQFPTTPRERLAVTSYPFRAWIESPTNPGRDKSLPGMDLKTFPGMIAERFGVHNINPLGDHLSSTTPAYLTEFRKAVEDAASHMVDLGVGGRDFCDPAKASEALDYGRHWVDIAAQLGSPSIRQHLKSAPGVKPSAAAAAGTLARLADYGVQKNVVINLENDAPGAEDPFFIIDVLDKVNHPYLRGLPDIGDSLREYNAADNRKAVNAMFQHAYNMSHVKDVLLTRIGDAPPVVHEVDVPEMFALARANHYKGYFSMEYDTAAGDAYAGTEKLVKMSLQYM